MRLDSGQWKILALVFGAGLALLMVMRTFEPRPSLEHGENHQGNFRADTTASTCAPAASLVQGGSLDSAAHSSSGGSSCVFDPAQCPKCPEQQPCPECTLPSTSIGGRTVSAMEYCNSLIKGVPDMACKGLPSPANAVIVTYDPRTEHISKTPGNYLQTMADILKRELPAPSKVLDVGANLGFFTISALGMGHSAVSFEPGFENRRRLELSVAANMAVGRAHIMPQAIGADAAVLRLFLNPGNAVLKSDGIVATGPDDPAIASYKTGKDWYLETIAVMRLDDFNAAGRLNDVVATKIDVEGFEGLVIPGAKGFFGSAKTLKLIFIELNGALWNSPSRKSHPSWMSMADAVSYFESLGFEAHHEGEFAKSSNSRVVSSTEVRSQQDSKGFRMDLVFIRR
jgi:FkbM family methyltransferase